MSKNKGKNNLSHQEKLIKAEIKIRKNPIVKSLSIKMIMKKVKRKLLSLKRKFSTIIKTLYHFWKLKPPKTFF